MPTITRFEEIKAWQTVRELWQRKPSIKLSSLLLILKHTHPQSQKLREDSAEYEV